MKTSTNRRRVQVVVAASAAVLLLGGGGAYGANAYAKDQICSAIEGGTASLSGSESKDSSSASDDIAEVESTRSKLETYARMLVVDTDLKNAVEGLIADIGQMITLKKAMDSGAGEGMEVLAEMFSLAGSVNTHVRQAQDACGLPAIGIPSKSGKEKATTSEAVLEPQTISTAPDAYGTDASDEELLEAARLAVQTRQDRVGSLDYASAYDMFAAAGKALWPRKQYVAFTEGCDERKMATGDLDEDDLSTKYRVTDPRWADPGKKRVTVTVAGAGKPWTITAVHELGEWKVLGSDALRKTMVNVSKQGVEAVVAEECTLGD
ncbi:hypothetical protein [Couchioplanes caeruleus]|nr:hypothetical protein [Couchioplanes caeruleus]